MDTSNTNLNDLDPHSGVVIKKSIAGYTVQAGARVIACALSSRLQKPSQLFSHASKSGRARPRNSRAGRTVPHHDPVAVGDRVHFTETGPGTGLILALLPRRNKLARQSAVPMPSARPFEQVIVANLDQVVPVFSAADPPPSWNLLDRYLVSAESAGLPSLVCITKVDLIGAGAIDGHSARHDGLGSAVADYRRIGYPVLLVSAVTGHGLDELRRHLRGRVSVFLGKSGVGKTSLLNALQPGLGLRVAQVSQATGKGKHTTSHQEMFSLDFGGSIVDTPGVREFGLWDVNDEDLALFFPEMQPFVGRCKFGLGCRHTDEPGCAIRKAVSAGHVSPHRYKSYLRLSLDA